MLCTDDTSVVVASGTSLQVVTISTATVQSTTTLSSDVLAMHAAFGYLAVGTNDKRIHLYQMPDCTLVTSIDILKRCASLYIANVEGNVFVLVADKFADVWAYPVSSLMKSRSFVLQHSTSSITQMRVVPSLGKIFTADQDEKIRVSHFPASHVVSNYCLGHTKIVSSIDILTVGSPAILLSGSGDGTLRSWDPETGLLLNTIQFDGTLSNNDVVVTALTCSSQTRTVTFAVVHDGKSKVKVATIDDKGKITLTSEQSLNGVVVGIISIGETNEETTHVAYVDDKGNLSWSHSSSSSVLANTLNGLKLPPMTLHKVATSAPKGERVRERQAAEATEQRKKAKLENKT
tara:strand:- start:187 stop:1227 length:1041 start_codon:yes stop_codon:yes gene_type:complete